MQRASLIQFMIKRFAVLKRIGFEKPALIQKPGLEKLMYSRSAPVPKLRISKNYFYNQKTAPKEEASMYAIRNGIAAGFTATLALSLLMWIQSAAGLLPEVDLIHMLTNIGHSYFGLPLNSGTGWVLHFFIGTLLWGELYALTVADSRRPNLWLTGIYFALAAWVVMMMIIMPMAGAGLFAMQLGITAPGLSAPFATLLFHLIYGAVLGTTYDKLQQRSTLRHSVQVN